MRFQLSSIPSISLPASLHLTYRFPPSLEPDVDNCDGRYDYYLLLKTLNADPGFMWCLRPRCPSGQIFMYSLRKVWCHKCRFQMCRSCQVPWHDGLTCAEHRDLPQSANNTSSEKLAQETTQPCPRCETRIEKNKGCVSMICEFIVHVQLRLEVAANSLA